MYTNIFIKLESYNIYTTHQPFELGTQIVSVSCEWFSLSGLLRRLHGVFVCEYDTIYYITVIKASISKQKYI